MKKIGELNFFNTIQLELAVNSFIASHYELTFARSFGFIGVSPNQFFHVFDNAAYMENRNILDSLSDQPNCLVSLKKNDKGEFKEFVFFTSAESPLIPDVIQTANNFEHVLIYFSGKAFDKEVLFKKIKKFSFRSVLNINRWVDVDDGSILEINLNITHNLVSAIGRGNSVKTNIA